MWKANGKTTTLLLFLDSLFQKQRQMRDASSGDLKEKRRYWKLKEEALDRTLWRTRFGRGYGPVFRQITV
jgi:hypothetical protein